MYDTHVCQYIPKQLTFRVPFWSDGLREIGHERISCISKHARVDDLIILSQI